MAKQFKDFNKEAKDLLTKNYPAAGTWKIEAKEKGGDRTFVLSPTADWKGASKASLAVDIDYNMKEYALKTKTNVNANGNVKPKVTYDCCPGHKIEATLNSLSADSDFEITYEGAVAGALVYDKVTKTQAEAQLAYPVGPVVVGASVVFAYEKGLKSWGVGARYSDKMFTASLVTKDLKTYTTAVYAPLSISGNKILVGAQVDCGHNKCDVTVGAEANLACCCGIDAKLRVKATQAGAVSLSVIRKFVNNWTATIAVEVKDVTKFGVQLTRE